MAQHRIRIRAEVFRVLIALSALLSIVYALGAERKW